MWEALLSWIDYNSASRLVHLPKIMGGVRLGLLANSVRNFFQLISKLIY